MEKEVVAALGRIPLFEDTNRQDISAERLGGLTNRNYRIECPAGRFVLRLAGEGTAEYIDRQVEEHNARFELFEQLDSYLGMMNKLSARIPDGYEEVQNRAEAVQCGPG